MCEYRSEYCRSGLCYECDTLTLCFAVRTTFLGALVRILAVGLVGYDLAGNLGHIDALAGNFV